MGSERLHELRTPTVRGRAGAWLGGDGALTHLVTAGHLFPPGPAEVSSPDGIVVVNGLDRADWRERRDVALVALREPTPGPPSRVGPVGSFVRIDDDEAKLWVGPPLEAARFSAPARAQSVVLRGLCWVSPARSVDGDSGAPIRDAVIREQIVGILVGVYGARTVFEPLWPAIEALRRWTGLALCVHPDSGPPNPESDSASNSSSSA